MRNSWFYWLLIIILFLLAEQKGHTQSLDWTKVIGSKSAGGTSSQRSSSLTRTVQFTSVDDSGNVYALCQFLGSYGLMNEDTVFNFSSTGNPRAVVLFKLSPDGDTLWQRKVESYYNSTLLATGLEITPDGNILVSVRTTGRFYFNGVVYDNFGDYLRRNILVFKVDPSNSLIWERSFISHFWSMVNLSFGGMASGSNEETYISFRIEGSSLTMVTDTSYIGIGAGTSFSFDGNQVLLKLDENGGYLWHKGFRARVDYDLSSAYIGEIDRFGDVVVDDHQNVYMTTWLDSGIVDGVVLPSHIVWENTIHASYQLMRFDSSGNLDWIRTIGNDSILNNYFFRTPAAWLSYHGGSLYMTANFFGRNTYYEDSLIQSPYTRGSTILEIDTAGDLLQIGGAKEPYEVSDFQVTDSSFVVALVPNWYDLNSSGLDFHFSGDQIVRNIQTKSYIARFDRNDGEWGVFTEFEPVTPIEDVYTLSVAIDKEDYIVFGGRFVNRLVLEDDTFFIPNYEANSANGFLTRYKRCDYLDPSILSNNDTVSICNGGQFDLHAYCPVGNANFQWYYGSSAIPYANDSIYSATLPGEYSVEASDSSCAWRSSSVFVSTGSPQSVSFSMSSTTFCQPDPPLALSASPSGGYFFGPGVSSGYFSPASAGSGIHTLGYVFDQGTGCIDTVLQVVSVESMPSTVFFQTFSSACVGETIVLNTGFPTGGSYSGPGVVGNVFSPGIGDTGAVSLVYSYSTSSGCTSSDTIDIVVSPTPVVSLNLGTSSTCEIVNFIGLNGQSPSGGTFTGTAVTGNFFIPTVAGPGSFPITYSITSGGCTGTAEDTITVDSFPSVVLPLLDSVCVGAVGLDLSHGHPSGGTYFGSGIFGNALDASVPGIGSTSVMYVYENACAADTAYSTLNVIANPSLSSLITDVICFGGSDGAVAASVTGGNHPYSYQWNNGNDSSNISSVVAGTYTVTASGEGGCVTTGSYTVGQPAVLSIILDSLDNVVCNGFNNGGAYITVSGGSIPYAFAWSNGSTSEDATSIGEGLHTVAVADANGCQDSTTFTIFETSPIVIASNVDDISCYGASDGMISTSVSGGGGTYGYLWSNGATSASLASLDSGSYFLTVTDQNGCSALDTSQMIEPDSILLELFSNDPTCLGYSDGSITTNTSGGTGALAFLWSTASTLDSIGSIPSGTFTVTVSDGNGCTKSSSVTLIDPDSLSLSISELQSILCQGSDDGALSVNAMNGVLPYAYSWSEASTTAIITGLTMGTYTATVTDNNGCSNSTSYILGEPSPLILSIDSIVDPNCTGDSNGIIYTTTSGGTGSVSYMWSNGATSSSITVDSGLYQITVFDANGCVAVDSVVVTDPDAILATFNVTDVSCYGANDGTITTSVTNTVGSPTYLWSNGATSINLSALDGGSYSLTITDANGCEGMAQAEVLEPTAVSLSSALITDNECFGDSSASIIAQAAGGWGAPYGYVWSTGDTASVLDLLAAGTYALTVTGNAGCTFDTSFVITDPSPLALSVDSMWMPLCFGDTNGYIDLSGTGGNNLYSWTWSDGGSTATRTDLGAGTYSITLIDGASGTCTVDTTLTITTPDALIIGIDSLMGVLCHGDSSGVLSVSAQGGVAPYTYLWNNGASTSTLADAPAGLYTLNLTDTNGCEAQFAQSITEPAQLQSLPGWTPATCSNGSDGTIQVTVTGGIAPYAFAWANGGASNQQFNLTPGLYVFNITDSNGCNIVDSVDLDFINQAPIAYLGADTGICIGDSIQLNAGDVGTYQWSTGGTSETELVTTAGQYNVTIMGAGGCADADTIIVEQYPLPVIDLGNDTLICQAHLNAGILLIGPGDMTNYTWSTGSTSSNETVSAFGAYWLVVENEFGCNASDTVLVINDTCLGAAQVEFSDWNVYPNPTRGELTIETAHWILGNNRLVLYNAAGQAVLTQSINSTRHSIDLGSVACGLYFLEISNKGELLHREKVIVN